MTCSLHPLDCATDHICRPASLRCTGPGQWSGPCPVCHGPRKLSLAVKSGRLVWICHRKPPCSLTAIRDALAELVPCISRSRQPKRPAINHDDLAALILSEMPPVSLRLAVLEMTGMSTTAALEKLGVRRENRARVINGRASIRMQNRRSASASIWMTPPGV